MHLCARALATAIGALLAAPSAHAQAVADRIASGTVVVVELAERLDSAAVKRGDTFAIRLMRPLKIGDAVVVPAGAMGRGEVIEAKSSTSKHIFQLNDSAKLLLAARYLEFDGQRIPLRGFHLGAAEVNPTDTLYVSKYGAALGRTTPNKEAVLPAGLVGEAKLAVDVDLKGHAVPTASAAPEPPK